MREAIIVNVEYYSERMDGGEHFMCDVRRHFIRMIIIVIPGFVSVRMLFNDPSSLHAQTGAAL